MAFCTMEAYRQECNLDRTVNIANSSSHALRSVWKNADIHLRGNLLRHDFTTQVMLRSLQHGIVVVGIIDAFVYAHNARRHRLVLSLCTGCFGRMCLTTVSQCLGSSLFFGPAVRRGERHLFYLHLLVLHLQALTITKIATCGTLCWSCSVTGKSAFAWKLWWMKFLLEGSHSLVILDSTSYATKAILLVFRETVPLLLSEVLLKSSLADCTIATV